MGGHGRPTHAVHVIYQETAAWGRKLSFNKYLSRATTYTGDGTTSKSALGLAPQGVSLLLGEAGVKHQFSSVAQSYPTLCDPTDCSTPGLPVHHQLLEFTQTHVH